jgi:hypothetical protein
MHAIRLWIRIMLFLSSYFPLSVILFVLLLPAHDYVLAIAILALGMLSLLALIAFITTSQSLSPSYETVATAQRRDTEIMGYITAYIFPFVTLPFSDWYKGSAFLVLFFIIGVLYVNSNLISINPMLSLARYHLYEVALTTSDATYLVLSKRVVKKGEQLPLIKLSEGILMEKASWRRQSNDERET